MERTAVYAHKGEYLGRLEFADDQRSLLSLASGARVWVPTEVLAVRGDGTLELQAPLLEVGSRARQEGANEHESLARERPSSADQPTYVPVSEERIAVQKVQRPRGTVSVHVVPQVEHHQLEIPLREQHTEVKHVEIGKLVERPPAVRQEGDTVIIPLVEEVLVVEKRLMLREEIHLTRRERTRIEERAVDVRRERAEITRTPPPQR